MLSDSSEGEPLIKRLRTRAARNDTVKTSTSKSLAKEQPPSKSRSKATVPVPIREKPMPSASKTMSSAAIGEEQLQPATMDPRDQFIKQLLNENEKLSVELAGANESLMPHLNNRQANRQATGKLSDDIKDLYESLQDKDNAFKEHQIAAQGRFQELQTENMRLNETITELHQSHKEQLSVARDKQERAEESAVLYQQKVKKAKSELEYRKRSLESAPSRQEPPAMILKTNVAVNKKEQRVDIPLPDCPEDTVKWIRQQNLCFNAILRGDCSHYPCRYDHPKNLSPERTTALKIWMRSHCCETGLYCVAKDCYKGHQCPVINCPGGKGDICPLHFPSGMHNIDTKIVNEAELLPMNAPLSSHFQNDGGKVIGMTSTSSTPPAGFKSGYDASLFTTRGEGKQLQQASSRTGTPRSKNIYDTWDEKQALRCKHCPRVFDTKSKLQDHGMAVHTVEREHGNTRRLSESRLVFGDSYRPDERSRKRRRVDD